MLCARAKRRMDSDTKRPSATGAKFHFLVIRRHISGSALAFPPSHQFDVARLIVDDHDRAVGCHLKGQNSDERFRSAAPPGRFAQTNGGLRWARSAVR